MEKRLETGIIKQNKEKKRNLGLSSPSKFSDMITSIGGKYRTATGAILQSQPLGVQKCQ